MILETTCLHCGTKLAIHSRTTSFQCPDCRGTSLVRESSEPKFEQGTKIMKEEQSHD